MFALTKRRKGAGAGRATPPARRTPAPWAASLCPHRGPATLQKQRPHHNPAWHPLPRRGGRTGERRCGRSRAGASPPSLPVHLKPGASLKAAASRKLAPGGRVPVPPGSFPLIPSLLARGDRPAPGTGGHRASFLRAVALVIPVTCLPGKGLSRCYSTFLF